jgi:hypothetical protein
MFVTPSKADLRIGANRLVKMLKRSPQLLGLG